MVNQIFEKRSEMPVSAEELFAWHLRTGAFERLGAPWEPPATTLRSGSVRDGGEHVFRVPFGPIQLRWVAHYSDCIEGRQFRDTQAQGPFAFWQHTHRFEPAGEGRSTLVDHIEYRLPLGLVGQWVMGGRIRGMLERISRYRHAVTGDDLKFNAAHRSAPMHVVISGASGLVGTALTAALTGAGHRVSSLSRAPADPMQHRLHWDPEKKDLDKACFNGVDAVVHLAGDNIGAGRWSAAKKKKMRDSRILGTMLISDTLAKLQRAPGVLVSATAVGIYGDRGDEELTEESAPGSDYLAGLCQEWEQAVEPAVQKGIRVVLPRFGVILSPRGGALRKMLTPFKMGVGGRIGSGRQYLSWITLDDAVAAIQHLIHTSTLKGPVNVVAPTPVTNLEFTKTLGKVLHRPTILPMPAFMVKLLFGEMGKALLLSSQKVKPAVLAQSGFQFRHPTLEEGLRHVLGR
ncbi:MAG TPA: TIGR01777 family oxidoreductase [Planctomycetota bacterium]|nr:TIGR01777 family oxidoreductase [Planctomycetota bacterium]